MMDQTKAEAAMQVNYWSFTRIVGALSRQMMRAKDGRIVAIGSDHGAALNQGNAAYAASKAALLSYVKTLAIELGANRRDRKLHRTGLHRHAKWSRLTPSSASRWKARFRRGASPIRMRGRGRGGISAVAPGLLCYWRGAAG